MARANWDACFADVVGVEGGYSDDPDDKGNWTGCSVNAGILKGTKYGISACSYPDLDIKNLTKPAAEEIYANDYWNPVHGDELPYGVDLCTFDGSVNSGVYHGVWWLQRAVLVEATGTMDEATIQAAAAADPDVTIERMCDDRLNTLRTYPTWAEYEDGWTNRVNEIRAEAHAMVANQPPPSPAPDVSTVTITIRGTGPITVEVTGAATVAPTT